MLSARKSQGSLEYTIIMGFVLVLIGIIMYVSGKYLVQISNEEKDLKIEDFADSVNNEFLILTKVEKGYYREIELNDNNYDVYINYTSEQLVITDVLNNESKNFDIIGDYNVTLENRTIGADNKTYIIFRKDVDVKEKSVFFS